MKRRTPLRPSRPPRRKTRLAPRNAKRRESEFARCYGSRARVAWVKAQACIVCATIHPLFGLVKGGCHNAHTVTGGKGRKADASTIVPMCPEHHRRYDQHRYPLDDSAFRESIKAFAARVDAAWQAHVSGTLAGTTKRRTVA